jgi:hypothetical protein
MVDVRRIIDLLGSPIVEWDNQYKPTATLQLCSQFAKRLDRMRNVLQGMIRYYYIRDGIGHLRRSCVHLNPILESYAASCRIYFDAQTSRTRNIPKGESGSTAKIEDTIRRVYVTPKLQRLNSAAHLRQ